MSTQAAAQSNDVITISRYLSLCNPATSSSNGFRILCAVLSFLRPMHAHGIPAQSLRPSQLLLHRSGQVTLQQSLPVPPIEAELYTSPEQAATGQPSLPSEIFSLGILFFELLNPIQDQQLRESLLRDVRRRVLPPGFMEQHSSHETAFLMALIHPDATKRPTVDQIICSNLLNMLRASFNPASQGSGLLAQQQQQQIVQQNKSSEEQWRRQHHPQQQDQGRRSSPVQQGGQHQPQQGAPPPRPGVSSETLLDFLSIMRQTTLNAVEKAQHQLSFLDADISEVNTRALLLQNQQLGGDPQSPDELQQQSSAPSLLYSQAPPPLELRHPSSRKRQRSWEEEGPSGSVDPSCAEETQADHKRDRITQSCHNMDRAFADLERKFFLRRERPASPAGTSTADLSDSSHVDLPGLAGLSDHLTDFSSDLIEFSRYSHLKVSISSWPFRCLLQHQAYC